MPPPHKAARELGVSYRTFGDEDLPFVAELYASTRLEELATTGWPPETQAAFLAHQHAAQHNHYKLHFADAEWLIIERKGQAIGRLYWRELSENLHIVDISLMPQSRGEGVGGAILRDILDRAGELGKGVTIHVEKQNPARSLYARLGFEVVEDRGVYDFLRALPEGPG